MKHVFYFLSIAPILFEAMNLTSTAKVHDFITRLKDMKGKPFDDYSSTQKAFTLLMFLYLIWAFIGLFTFQWPLFLTFFLFSLIPKRYKWYRFIDSLISLLMLLFILLNAYHLKLDIWSLIKSFYNA